VAKLSVEKSYAKRLGLKMGDRLTFDIQGVSITGQVWNLRKVKWQSFLPNFFIIFEEGFLEDAPKTWLMSLRVPPGENSVSSAIAAQSELAKAFPNVSSLPVERLISEVIELSDQIIWIVLGLSGWILAISLVVYLILIGVDFHLRSQTWYLFRVVGANISDLAKLSRLELGGLLVVSSALGSLMALGLSYVLCEVILEVGFRADHISIFTFLGLTILLANCLSEVLFRQWRKNMSYESFLRQGD
jgi:putative ABC transport system permease protein